MRTPRASARSTGRLAFLLVAGLAACSDTADGNGNGNAVANNACQTGAPGCSTAALDSTGIGTATIIFGEERVEASAGNPSGQTPEGWATVSFSASTDGVAVSTTVPNDEFTDVRCASYSMGSFIQGALGEFLCFQYTQALTGNSAPVTLRVSDAGGGTFNLETAWGFCVCAGGGNGNGNGGLTCDGSTVGNGARDACCTGDDDCSSARCCTPDENCFSGLDDRWTCRSPL